MNCPMVMLRWTRNSQGAGTEAAISKGYRRPL
jgi:hypothetical protein